jgi:hypothetical protein
MIDLRPYGAVAAMAVVGVLAVNTGVATATGGEAMILGRTNFAHQTTILHRTSPGPALQLEGRPGSAPLAVNSTVKVAKLNADMVDGQSAAQLAPHAITYVIPVMAKSRSRVQVVLTGLRQGIYMASYNIVASVSTQHGRVACYLHETGRKIGLLSYGAPAGFGPYSSANASGVFDFRTGTQAIIECFAQTGGTFNFDNSLGDGDRVVSLMPLSTLSVRSDASVDPAARSGAAAPGAHSGAAG